MTEQNRAGRDRERAMAGNGKQGRFNIRLFCGCVSINRMAQHNVYARADALRTHTHTHICVCESVRNEKRKGNKREIDKQQRVMQHKQFTFQYSTRIM